MKITWLGQAGLLFEHNRFTVMIDPYLSDSVGRISPDKHRRVPVREELFSLRPDVMIFTHNHLDHYDPETAGRFIDESSDITVLSPTSVYNEVQKTGGSNNYVLFNRHTSWSEGGLCFTAVKAEHSDPAAIGVIIDDGDKKYYVTGDTLYNDDIFADLPCSIYAVFLPVNGVGNNMNMTDAKRFCERVGARYSVPLHCGLFDCIDMNALDTDNRIVPEFYEEIIFE
ncbi:MAG: MBL fold metallo-hydrolase [Eubacteriales bacterium]